MKHELSALIADYKAGKVGAREVGDILRDLRDRAGEPRPAGEFAHPLSEGQRGLWALQRAYPDMAAYNVPLCFRVSGLDVSVFQDACRALLVRHPVLNTVIRQDAGEPTQSLDPAPRPRLRDGRPRRTRATRARPWPPSSVRASGCSHSAGRRGRTATACSASASSTARRANASS